MGTKAAAPPNRWRTTEELAEIGFGRSLVVMMNEAHDGLRRSISAREVGRQLLPTAHRLGVRHLSMEALRPDFAAQGNATRTGPPADEEAPSDWPFRYGADAYLLSTDNAVS